MEITKFEELLTELKISKNKWVEFDEIDSIILKNGVGFYPNWKNLRFKIKNSNEILVAHGTSVPYGARLSLIVNLSYNLQNIYIERKEVVPPTQYYESFRLPKVGDILRTSNGQTIDEDIIMDVKSSFNQFEICLAKPLKFQQGMRYSFYDPKEYDPEFCMHGTSVEGIYMKFTPNSGKMCKKNGIYHQIIKVKDISCINLKINSKNKNKTYSVR